MDSLKYLSACGKRAAFALMIISSLVLVSVAQTVEPQQQGKRFGDPGFVGEPINLNVVNADIRDILNYITEQYGINFVIDKSVKAVPVTVNVNNVPWNVALESVLRAQQLDVQVNGSILRIADQKTLADEQAIAQRIRDNQLDTSPLYTEFIRLNYARASGTLNGDSGGAGAFTSGVSSNSSNAGSVSNSTGSDQGILGIIQRRLSRRGAVEVDGRSNTLIITDVRENIDAIRQLVTLLDQPEPQVEIESRIVLASRIFSRDLGVQLSAVVVGGPNSNGAGGVFSTLPGNNTGIVGSGGGPPGAGATFPQPGTGLAAGITNTIIGLTTGVIGTARINALITAGEAKNQAKTIATPRITTLNNRPAQIESGSQIPVTSVQPGSGGGLGGAAVVTTEYVSVPLRLAVTPQITDVGMVLLNIVAENSSLATGGTAFAPAIATQRMQTQVMVPDGGTTVVGGALLDSEREEQNRTPGISRIPLLGNLFKRKGVFRNSDELLFFITPRIFRPDFQGNPTSGRISEGIRSTTILQPVPLGNPPSNSVVPTNTIPSTQQSPNVPVQPVQQTQPNVQPQTVPGNINRP